MPKRDWKRQHSCGCESCRNSIIELYNRNILLTSWIGEIKEWQKNHSCETNSGIDQT